MTLARSPGLAEVFTFSRYLHVFREAGHTAAGFPDCFGAGLTKNSIVCMESLHLAAEVEKTTSTYGMQLLV